MSTIALAMWIVAAVLFLIESWFLWKPAEGWASGRSVSLGLFFLTLGFIISAWH